MLYTEAIVKFDWLTAVGFAGARN